jgi:hypothetical protein
VTPVQLRTRSCHVVFIFDPHSQAPLRTPLHRFLENTLHPQEGVEKLRLHDPSKKHVTLQRIEDARGVVERQLLFGLPLFPGTPLMKEPQLDEETREQVRRSIARLESPRASDRWGAASTLGAMDPENAQSALPHLHSMRHDPDAFVRVSVASAITQLDPSDTSATLELAAFLEHSDEGVREACADSLIELVPRATQVIPALHKALHDPVVEVRRKAAVALAGFGPSAAEATPDLVRLLDDPSEDVRMSATLALSNMGSVALAALPDRWSPCSGRGAASGPPGSPAPGAGRS